MKFDQVIYFRIAAVMLFLIGIFNALSLIDNLTNYDSYKIASNAIGVLLNMLFALGMFYVSNQTKKQQEFTSFDFNEDPDQVIKDFQSKRKNKAIMN